MKKITWLSIALIACNSTGSVVIDPEGNIVDDTGTVENDDTGSTEETDSTDTEDEETDDTSDTEDTQDDTEPTLGTKH